jgi:hypothetical protein
VFIQSYASRAQESTCLFVRGGSLIRTDSGLVVQRSKLDVCFQVKFADVFDVEYLRTALRRNLGTSE